MNLDLRRGRLRRFAAAAAGLVLLLAAQPASADLRERLERLERWHGFGWGDGYHSCYDPGPRPWADRPPRPYARSAAPSLRRRCPNCPSAPTRPTFYDRLDAGRIPRAPSVLEPSAAGAPAAADADRLAAPPAEAVETPEAEAVPDASADRSDSAAAAGGVRPRIVGLHSTGPRR